MLDALRVLWKAVRHLNHRGYIYVWANLLAVVCSLPVFTAPAAWAGLVRLSYIAHTTPTASLDDYWEGFKSNLKRGLVLAVLNLLIFGINLSNLFTFTATDPATTLLRTVWVMILVAWIMFQMYLWPIFYHMEEPTLTGAARNAAVMLYLNPLFTLTLWALVLIIVVISTYVFALWGVLTVSFLALLATASVLDRLGVNVYISDYNEESNELS